MHSQQSTIVWHVDDLKISHVDSKVVDAIIDMLDKESGKETPICVSPIQIARDVLLPDIHPGHSLTYIHFSSVPLIQHSPEAGSPEEPLL